MLVLITLKNASTVSCTSTVITIFLTLIQSRIWNGPTGSDIQETILSWLAPDALLNQAVKNSSRPPSIFFKYGHYLIIVYIFLITAVWVGRHTPRQRVKNGLILLISIAASANLFIYWIGEYLTEYGRSLFLNYVEIPSILIASLLFLTISFREKKGENQRIFSTQYLLVGLTSFLFIILFKLIIHTPVLALLLLNLTLSLCYSDEYSTNWKTISLKTAIVPLLSFVLVAGTFAVFVFIQYKPTNIPGKQEIVPQLSLPKNTGIKISILNTGFNRMSKALSPGDPKWRPAPVFLIHHPKYGYILFDCGISKDVAVHGQGAMPFPMPLLFESKSSVDKIVDAQLMKYGIPTDSIKTIIISHLHEDHTGGLSLFNKSKVILHTNTHLETENLSVSNASSFTKHPKIIGDTFDLLGDSTLLLIETEGHTKDDLMLLVAADKGPVLLTGDAVVHFDWLNSNDVERLPENPEGAARVRNSIRQLLKVNKNLVVLPGHDIPKIPSTRTDVVKLFPENFTQKTTPQQ
jgi:N-acyl homoserine lactone hydrolase